MARAFQLSISVVGVIAVAPAAQAAGFCTAQWAPVCALKDGVEKTYSNASCAAADDAAVVRDGRCDEPRAPSPSSRSARCGGERAPVCAQKNDVAWIYSNARCAFADGAAVGSDGARPKPSASGSLPRLDAR